LHRNYSEKMDAEGLNQIVYSKNVIEFVAVASEFCRFAENVPRFPKREAIDYSRKILPLVYIKAVLLPPAETVLDDEIEKFVSEFDYNILLQKWVDKLGEDDTYHEVFEPGLPYSEDTLENSISENILDIYQDLKDFISAYSLGNEEVMNDAIVVCRINFEDYWGQRLVNVLRALHMLMAGGKNLDEADGKDGNANTDNNKTGWLDGLFNQDRDNNF